MSEGWEGEDGEATQPVDRRARPSPVGAVLDESATGVLVFDEHRRLAYVNDVAARASGHPADAHIGKRLDQLHPQIASRVDPAVDRIFDERQPAHSEELVWESPQPPHDRRYWQVSYVPVRAATEERYVAVIYVDTTQVRRAHERLARLIDALPTFVGMCTPDGVVVEGNAATLAATDLSREELVGTPLWEASWWRDDPDVQRQLRDMVALAQQGQPARGDIEVCRTSGRALTIDFQLVPIIEHGSVTALVPSGIDITDRISERDRLQALAVLSRHLNGALTTNQVARLVVANATAVVDADFVNVALLDSDRQELRLVQPLTAVNIEQGWGTVPLDGPRTPLLDAVDTGRAIVVTAERRRTDYPHMVADMARVGLDSTAALPLVDETGDVIGVLGIGWRDRVDFADDVRLRLNLLADLCSHALRRAQRTEARDQLVQELQSEVLAAPDHSRTLDVALTYEPSRGDIGFGGDWYDVIEVDGSCTALVVGDVAGHGITAAARMTEAKATIRTLVLNVPHAGVIPAANRSLAHFDSGYIATAAVAWIDTDENTLEWRLAGHVPPVLRMPDGTTQLLSGVHHPPIGTDTAARDEDAVAFPPGSMLVLYTDGLIERRGEDIDVGLERLRSLVEGLPADCCSVDARDAIMRGLRVDDREDDVAIVVVRNL